MRMRVYQEIFSIDNLINQLTKFKSLNNLNKKIFYQTAAPLSKKPITKKPSPIKLFLIHETILIPACCWNNNSGGSAGHLFENIAFLYL